MAVNNSAAIKSYQGVLTTGGFADLVFESRAPIQEEYTTGKDGTQTINWDFTLVTTQEAEKADIVNSQAYADIIAPFLLGTSIFYPETVTLTRTDHVYGNKLDKTSGSAVPAAKWNVKIVYKTNQAVNQRKEKADRDLKPSEREPVVTWSSSKFDMATTTDAVSNTYRNTAGDYFDGISRPEQERIYTITSSVAVNIDPMATSTVPKSQAVITAELKAFHTNNVSYEPGFLALSNYVNNSAVSILGTKWAANTLLVTSASMSEVKIANDEVYFDTKMTVAARWWGWQREVANRGTNELQWFVPTGAIRPASTSFTALPAQDTPVQMDSPQLDAGLAFWRNKGGLDNKLTTLSDEQAMADRTIFAFTKAPAADAKGRPMRDAVFLDGWGQQDSSAAVAPGVIGTAIYTAGTAWSTVDINVYEFLGQKVRFANHGVSVYVPEQATHLRQIHDNLGHTNHAAMFAAKSSNILPHVWSRDLPSTTNGVPTSPSTRTFRPDVSGQDTLIFTPGIKLTFQDYRSANLTAIPGVQVLP